MFGALGNMIGGGLFKIADYMHDEEMQDDAQSFNSAEAARNREFQREMRSSQYQTAVSDMRAAGLNPALAYQQGGAGTPSGSAATSGAVSGRTPLDMSAVQVNSAHAGKLNAETANVEADTRLKLEGQLPELLQRVLTGKASASEMDARKKVLDQEFRVLEEKLKWLPMMQQFSTEKLSYEVMEKLKQFQMDYPEIRKQVIEAKLLGLKVPEGLAEAAFWTKEGQPATYFRHAPQNVTKALGGAMGSGAKDLEDMLRKFFGGSK